MFSKTKLKFDDIFENRLSNEEVKKYLIKLYNDGESAEDIASAASAMREHVIPLNIPYSLKEELIDNTGTGGDNSNSFNISTTVAILISACGSKVAKHGNRSIGTNIGSADMLEYLGVKLDLSLENHIQMLEQIGFCFLVEENFHPSMKYILPIRKNIFHKTIFNILSPLSNPAMVHKQFVGVYDRSMVSKVANALTLLGTKRAMVVNSNDNMDEISISDITHAAFVERGSVNEFTIDPREYGFNLYDKRELEGKDAKENALIAKGILDGSLNGAKRDIVLLNAGFTLLVDGKVKSTEEGIIMAKNAINSGKAINKLQEIIDISNKLK